MSSTFGDENNQIILKASRVNVIYNNSPRTREPRVEVNFIAKHQLITYDNIDRISLNDGFIYDERVQVFTEPLRTFVGEVGPIAAAAVEGMVSNLAFQFEFRPGVGRVLWLDERTGDITRLRTINHLGGKIRESVKRIVGEVMEETELGGSPPVKTIVIGVFIWRRTVLDNDLYASPHGVNGGGDGLAVEGPFETVTYDGGEDDQLVCAICTDEVLSGTHMARLPCSHMFHGDCIVPWLQRKRTCPMCRFNLPNNV